ncbi:NO-associated protein 1 chloroplastic/mitochondrial [Zea mays]|uniref:NO-associated protein 1 chloroplastic/mitochondrial n=1 Tax=Zea mays TaxID=4577 RepID=A0A1D6KCV6_MAIZE|nr:NO-associated protein 1 chloroplastic/mitochondrial [Zea mays]
MPPPEKPSKPSFLRRSRFRLGEASSEFAGGQRSCDTDPQFSLDADRMSVSDMGFSWDEPRASAEMYIYWQYNFGECKLCFCLSASVAISDLNHTLLQGSTNVGKSAFISAMLRTMAYKDPVAATAQKYKPIQSVVPGTTLGPIQIESFLGGGNMCLIEFYTSSWKRKPHQVIIFRNDVSESQFNLVLNIELQQIIDGD